MNLSSRIISTVLCLLFVAAASVSRAQDDLPKLYVSDKFEVPVRKTGCNNCTIVHYGLASGTMVFDLGQTDEDWRLIRTPGGIEGWMPARFLVAEPIARDRLNAAEKALTDSKEENRLLSAQIEDLLADLTTMGLSVENLQSEANADGESRPVLSISGDVIGLNSQNEDLIRKNQYLQQELDILTARNERLEDSSQRTWFFYGALAVLAGSLLSVILPRIMPRKKYSEWA